MRIIDGKDVTAAVCRLFIQANTVLPADVRRAVLEARECESNARARSVLDMMEKNWKAAETSGVPICQDTGMAVVFADIGADVYIEGGPLSAAVDEGVRRAYREGYLRKSVVADPLRRVNTDDNTPAVLHIRTVEGDRLRLTAVPKGFGSENMSSLRMFTPSASEEDILGFVVDTVVSAGSNPCPPMTVGVGLGGTFEMACIIAKRALMRSAGDLNPIPYYAGLERRLLEMINKTGIGPQGFGGRTTALSVAIETYPTHIAGLPAAVNIGCHVNRHASVEL